MGYIITAEVDTRSEVNMGGDRSKVDARVLSDRDGVVTFDIRGDFHQQPHLVRGLCESLIDAGFLEFRISHSY